MRWLWFAPWLSWSYFIKHSIYMRWIQYYPRLLAHQTQTDSHWFIEMQPKEEKQYGLSSGMNQFIHFIPIQWRCACMYIRLWELPGQILHLHDARLLNIQFFLQKKYNTVFFYFVYVQQTPTGARNLFGFDCSFPFFSARINLVEWF